MNVFLYHHFTITLPRLWFPELHGACKEFKPAFIKTYMDHRMAMSFVVFALKSQTKITIDDVAIIATSFPNFFDLLTHLGIKFD